MRVYVYGGKDGPAFDNRCPKCKRYMKMPETLSYKINEFTGMMKVTTRDPFRCSRCGVVQADHIGWGGDYLD